MIVQGGIKFDNVEFNINTWYKVLEEDSFNNNILLANQGVNNNLTTGVIYISLRNDDDNETVDINDPKLITLFPGDNFRVDYDSKIWAQADTLNSCLHYDFIKGA